MKDWTRSATSTRRKRYVLFMHFSILTFCGSQPGDPCAGSWAQANLDITKFSPSSMYDPGQWADAAVSAHMKFGVLTTRHHDGFALWPSAASSFNVGHIPWKNGQGDVVRDYVDAFRSRGLLPGLYYSIWDSTEGIGNSATITAAQLDYVKTQITELLTNYGPIPILVIDGWTWKMGHNKVAYQKIRELVKSLQPNCLLTDHTHLVDPWEVDIVNFEEPTGAFAPGEQHLRRRAGHEDQRQRRQRLVLGAEHRQPDERHGDRRPAPRDARAALHELHPQLPAQPRRPARRGDRDPARRSRRRLEPEPERARRCRRRRGSSSTPTRRSARRPPAARRPTRSTASTTPACTRSGRPSGRCRSR